MKNLKKFKTFNINENVKYLKVGDYYSLLKPKGYWSGDWEYLGYDKKTKINRISEKSQKHLEYSKLITFTILLFEFLDSR